MAKSRISPIMTWFIVVLLLTACSGESPQERSVEPSKNEPASYEGTIVAVGDSLTAGLGVAEDKAYPARLAVMLNADGLNYRVVNAGVSGETSSGALSRIQWVISSLNPDIVVLETGANDGLRGIDPRLLESNLDQIVTILKQADIQVVLAGMRMLPNLGPDYIEAFSTIFPKLAKKHDLIFMPFFLDGVAGMPEYNQADKIHPTAEGYGKIVKNLYPYVLKAIDAHRGKTG